MRTKWLYLSFIVLMLIAGATAKSQTISSNDFQELIKNGSTEIILDQHYVKGHLFLHQLGGQLNKKITISNSIFEGDIHFDKMTFLEDVTFKNTTFKEDVLFPGATFLKNASFEESKFERRADFSDTEFEESIDFSGAEFNGSAKFENSNLTNASFEYAKFLGLTYFQEARFIGTANFYNSEFHGPAYFNGAKFLDGLSAMRCRFYKISEFKNASFDNTALFRNTNFYEDSNFEVSNFNGNSNFREVIFWKPVTFRGSKFKEYAIFKKSIFNNSADFKSTNFSSDVDFSDSTFKNDASFVSSKFMYEAKFAKTRFDDANFWKSFFGGKADFSESKFNQAFFEDCNFSGTLDLNKAKYDKMYIRIKDIDKLAFSETTYKSLIDNFKKLGFIEDANDCYYRFMVEYSQKLNNKIKTMQINTNEVSTDSLDNLFLSAYYLFSWIFYGFGTKPLYTLIWSLVLMIFVFGPFWWHVQRKSSEKKGDEYSWDNYDHRASFKSDINYKFHEIINAIMLSGSIFLSGTKFFIDPPDLPEALEKVTPWVRPVFKLERFFGGVLSILFLISIGSVIFSI